MKTRLLRHLRHLVSVLLLSGCAGISPTIDYNDQYSFADIERYRFIARDELQRLSPLISDITRNRIEIELERQLNAKGYSYAASLEQADILVSYHIISRDKKSVQTYNSGVRACWRCGPGMATDVRVKEYTEGTLIVDMIEPRERKSVWRGVVSGRVNPKLEPAERTEKVKEVVAAILSEFPPKR